ncbi:hypothetical protein ACHAXR_010609 [Thalassiosira sp. AJA248-18]
MGKAKNGSKNGGAKSRGRSRSNSGSGGTTAVVNNSPPPPATTPPKGQFTIKLTFLFLLLTFVISTVIAFSIGWIARLILLSHIGITPYGHKNNDAASGKHSTTALTTLPTISGSAGERGIMSAKKSLSGVEIEVIGKTMSGKKVSMQLPSPKVLEGKDVPFTTYASKTFQMAGVATSNTLHIDRSTALIMTKSRKDFDGGPDFTTQTAADAAIGNSGVEGENSSETESSSKDDNNDGWVPCDEKSCSRGKEKAPPSSDPDHNDDSDGLHLPAGQHLLVDIKDVDSNFLNSEERLAQAMIELTNETKLTLLSYHCHSLVPIGVSCAGVLLESHVAFHTWPLEGVITMDLFTCGGGLLIPTLPTIEKLFGVPMEAGEGDIVPQPTMLWSHKLRGFREGFAPGYVRSKNPLDGSLGRYVLGKLDFDIKRPLLSTKTAIQSVNIYEVMEPTSRDVNSYVKSIAGEEEGSYEATYPEYFGPDKVLFLDGIIQSTLYGDAPYHESIVHPAMITHNNPKRVAIIGGGEGATLREVLKYKSVEEVVILEIDQELVEICAEYMPEWSDCSDIEGSDAESCFGDSRARLVYMDAFQWFIDNFGKDGNDENNEEKKFDVIIMDALDPNTSVEIAGGLYDDTSFVDSLSNGLTAEGVFVVQLGKSKMSSDPPDEVGRFKDTALMIDALEESGFKSIHNYDEGHSRFYMPWSYLVAFKHYETRAGWHRTAPQIEIELQQRLHKTKSGKSVLRYFDAATMMGYQVPSKAEETVYCRKEKFPYECEEFAGIHPEYVSLPASEYLKVMSSGIGDHAGRGLFAKKDIPKDSTLALDEAGKSFHFPPLTWSVISKLMKWADDVYDTIPVIEDEISGVFTFAEGYGHGAKLLGETHYAVDSGVMLFMNHGCNGTNNYGYIYDEDREIFTENSIDLDDITEIIQQNLLNSAEAYSPAMERNYRHGLNSGDYALREIKKGEEILTDYLSFSGDLVGFKEDVLSLRRQCAGEGVGDITNYESESS